MLYYLNCFQSLLFTCFQCVIDPDCKCFFAVQVVSKSITAPHIPDRNKICQNGRVPIYPDVQPRPASRQTSFSGQGDARESNLPFSGHIVNTLQRPTILQVNIEGLTASKMSVLHQLAVQHEALAILLQKTHCTSSEKLILPSFALARFSLSRKHSLATFVHEQLKYTFLKQSLLKSKTEWLCVNVDGYKIVNVYKPPPTRLQASDLLVFLTPVVMLVILTARMLTGAMVPTVWMESAWLVGQVLTTLLSFIIQRILPAFILTAGTMILTLILRLLVLTWTAAYLTDVC